MSKNPPAGLQNAPQASTTLYHACMNMRLQAKNDQEGVISRSLLYKSFCM